VTRIFRQKVLVSQIVKKFLSLCGIRNWITVMKSHQRSYPCICFYFLFLCGVLFYAY